MTDAQERYWQLDRRCLCARNPITRTFARWQMRRFFHAHRGQSFRVFRPEWIAAAFSEDVTPLF